MGFSPYKDSPPCRPQRECSGDDSSLSCSAMFQQQILVVSEEWQVGGTGGGGVRSGSESEDRKGKRMANILLWIWRQWASDGSRHEWHFSLTGSILWTKTANVVHHLSSWYAFTVNVQVGTVGRGRVLERRLSGFREQRARRPGMAAGEGHQQHDVPSVVSMVGILTGHSCLCPGHAHRWQLSTNTTSLVWKYLLMSSSVIIRS